ncbi:MAG TPA: hypothetical protein VN688_24140 [Gemmataceae bacterium]|nr:hypothetical protein [Gemmataceae bacterium]
MPPIINANGKFSFERSCQNERFRYADPVADMAFVVMDLMFEGRRDLAKVFANAYFRAADDDEGRELLPLYTAYRSMIRAKVGGIKSAEAEIPESERASACFWKRRHAGACRRSFSFVAPIPASCGKGWSIAAGTFRTLTGRFINRWHKVGKK